MPTPTEGLKPFLQSPAKEVMMWEEAASGRAFETKAHRSQTLVFVVWQHNVRSWNPRKAREVGKAGLKGPDRAGHRHSGGSAHEVQSQFKDKNHWVREQQQGVSGQWVWHMSRRLEGGSCLDLGHHRGQGRCLSLFCLEKVCFRVLEG